MNLQKRIEMGNEKIKDFFRMPVLSFSKLCKCSPAHDVTLDDLAVFVDTECYLP